MRRGILWLCLAGLGVLALVAGSGSREAHGKGKGDALFSHATHYGAAGGGKIKECSDCHGYNPKDADYKRPGHSPCQDCHSEGGVSSIKVNFKDTNATDAFCMNCHIGKGYDLKNFPDPRKGFVGLERFSHKQHLDTGGKIFATFGKVSCDNCHDVNNKDGKAQMPQHKECGQCHGDAAGTQAVKPYLTSRAKQSDCLTCHSDATKNATMRPARAGSWEASYTGQYSKEVIFYHQKHLSHPKSKQACKECHAGVEDSSTITALHLPSMFSCGTCHNDAEVVTKAKVMDKCEACHSVIRKKEKPPAPLHYGPGNHQGGSKRPNIYCAWCHDKDPQAFPVKEKYEVKDDCKAEACVGCHKSEGVPEEVLDTCKVVPDQLSNKGGIQRKNGVYSTLTSRFDFRQVDNVAAPLDQVDAQDADLTALANVDAYGYWKENFGVSISGRFSLDVGNTPAQSPFASQFNLDQQPRDDRGRFLFDDDLGALQAQEFDRTQTAAFLVYRAFAELRDQELNGGKTRADLRVGRQSVYDSAEPWLLFDGGLASFKTGKKARVQFDAFGGSRTSIYARELKLVDELKPIGGANFAVTFNTSSPDSKLKLGPMTLKLQDVFHVGNSTRAALNWKMWPNLTSYADLHLANFAPNRAGAGFTYFNARTGTQLLFDYRHRFDNTTFDYDYTTLSTRGGADVLLADPTLQQAIDAGVNDDAAAVLAQVSQARQDLAAKKIGRGLVNERQIADFENFNLLPEAPHERFDAIFSQKIRKKVFLNFGFSARLVNPDLRQNANQIADNAIDINTTDQIENALITDVVAEDNRFAFTYPFVEFNPGLDFYDIGIPGLHAAVNANIRIADNEDIRLLFDQNTFFNDISGETDNNGLALNAEVSHSLNGGRVRFGALIGFHRYDVVGRYVVVDDNNVPLTALNAGDQVGDQQAGFRNLNGFSGSTWLRLRVGDHLFLRALYTAETDLQYFPDDPFILSGESGFQGGNLEFNSYDVVLLQRLTFAAGYNF